MPTITLGITYYNEKELLTECIESVYKQTVLPDEIIVYDDASRFPAKDYIPHHPAIPVKIIRGKKNIMVSGARNAIMNAGISDYIHYQDADDLFEPFCFEYLKNTLQKNPVDLVINEVRSVAFEDMKPISGAVMSLETVKKGSLVNFALKGSLLAPSPTFKKSLGLKLGGYKADKLLQCEDFEFSVRLAYYATNYEIITKPLIIQRLRKDSMSTDKKELYVEGIKALNFLKAELPEIYHPDIAERGSRMGRLLYQYGFYEEAKEAFRFANAFQDVPYRNENMVYQVLSKLLGQYNAEKISSGYRKLLPFRMRQKFTT